MSSVRPVNKLAKLPFLHQVTPPQTQQKLESEIASLPHTNHSMTSLDVIVHLVLAPQAYHCDHGKHAYNDCIVEHKLHTKSCSLLATPSSIDI